MTAAERASERRFGDRRRSRRPAAADESWFGAFAYDADTQVRDDGTSDLADAAALDARDSAHLEPDPAVAARGDRPGSTDWRFVSRTASRVAELGQTAFERLYRAFTAARAALGLALVAALAVGGVFGLRPTPAVTAISVAYAALAIGLWLLPFQRRAPPPREMAHLTRTQWIATIGVDLVCFTALHVLATSSSLNYVALLVLPVLMAGVLTPRLAALATAAGVTIALLVAAWLNLVGGTEGTVQMTQAGLAGTGFFVITVLAGELAGRLAREELTARGSLEMARQQAQLNRLVIEEMQDGVLVVDRRGRVRAANPAARRLLAPNGMSRPAPFQLRGVHAWDALVKTVERAFSEATWPEAGRDVVLQFENSSVNAIGAQRTLRVRVRFTRKREPQTIEEFCVMFLEDVRNMQARSRQEKLAAMGRVSAGIAHEIRNPLAAISQANALLEEDATDPAQRRLMAMVSDNVERLKRIVDDVMEVAPGAVPEVGVLDATAQVGAVCSEWARANQVALGADSILRVDLPTEPVGVLFDGEHLRRVLVNLLDNALRHASRNPGAIHLRLDSRHEAQAFLSVASDGAPIPPDVEPYLFEPFFSTRSRGTGLGLYICRELCERYGATIDYRLRADNLAQRNEFYVDMQRKALGPSLLN
ncbi:ATP-binding protein [Rhizobacter sp. Root404]|uniref:ATP-binding protein n=1 Tax=Rhizobacter sp. Root404 TaxID=1736528 RepID=UPI0006FB64F4|nr:ATP-binding protein [Rhizobacter sp. Root404]KQW40179.1 histidine kinase [Rhizobacter sp. Root404]